MRGSSKDGIVVVHTVIAFVLVGGMVAFGLYDAARIGLTESGWWAALTDQINRNTP